MTTPPRATLPELASRQVGIAYYAGDDLWLRTSAGLEHWKRVAGSGAKAIYEQVSTTHEEKVNG